MKFYERIQSELDALSAKDQFRQLRELCPQGSQALLEGRDLLNLSSNDYMGMGVHDEWRKEFYQALTDNPSDVRYALSASSSRLLTGNHPGYTELEDALGKMYGNRAALAFNSGYHSNIGILPALAGNRDLILCDKLNHASIIDGIRLADAKFKRYPHLNFERLEKILKTERDNYENVFIITESVFSMDGDIADLKQLVELKNKYDVILIVDEAHGVGVFGETGCGVCEAQGVTADIDIIVGTFGKALCSTGAYAIMEPVMRDYLINRMRPLIFTTALPPVIINWSRFILEKCQAMTAEREHLMKISAKLRDGFRAKGYETGGESQIIPLVVGENAKAVELAAKLRDAGILVFAIRPPTVPPNSARLRFSLTAALRETDIDKILEII
jgi:8-amino-7-oxononanoate synthase